MGKGEGLSVSLPRVSSLKSTDELELNMVRNNLH